MDKANLDDLFRAMNEVHVVVVGDVMLDNYWWGEVERISPEAPVPVVALRRRESRLGGAANVALNCRSLGARVFLASVIGCDAEGDSLVQLCAAAAIETTMLQRSSERPTTTKTRVISRNQQMMRLDDEATHFLTTIEEHTFIDTVLRYLQITKPHVVIFEDYNKGVLKENVIARIIAHCKEIGIVTAVDPKLQNFLSYRDVDIFKPNLKEVREGLHILLPLVNLPNLNEVHNMLSEAINQRVTLITLSEKGVYYNDGEAAAMLPSHIRNIADVSGAGDTVIATASLVYALTRNAALMAQVANIAGGLVCEQVGVAPMDKELLLHECRQLL